MSIKETMEKVKSKEIKESFKSFMEATKSSEILIVILKAHLYLERELILALTESIVDDKILQGTTFRQKLDLAHSIGMLNDIYGALGKVNSIRNSYAHDIEYVFKEKDFDDLLSTLTKEDKNDFLSVYDEMKIVFFDNTIPELNFKLQVLLSDIWFSLVGCRNFAKKSIEIKLMEKEIETMQKYGNPTS